MKLKIFAKEAANACGCLVGVWQQYMDVIVTSGNKETPPQWEAATSLKSCAHNILFKAQGLSVHSGTDLEDNSGYIENTKEQQPQEGRLQFGMP